MDLPLVLQNFTHCLRSLGCVRSRRRTSPRMPYTIRYFLGELKKVWCILRVFAYSSHLRAACNGPLFFVRRGCIVKGCKKGCFP